MLLIDLQGCCNQIHHRACHITAFHPPHKSFRAQAARSLLAQHIFASYTPTAINHIYNDEGQKQSLDQLLKGPDREIWSRSTSNEFGRIAQGNDFGVTFQDAVDYIPFSEVPKDRDVTYASFVCD